MNQYIEWTARDAAANIAVPAPHDDKYTRGVLGVITGSAPYPGAAVLGVEAALHTGLGMVRYLGPEPAAQLVLQRRPEAVTVPGRVQAWLLGSGIDAASRDVETTKRLTDAAGEGLPTVVDAGALDLLQASAFAGVTSRVVVTPHYRELGAVLGVTAATIASDPQEWASRTSQKLGVTVLLKGSRTYIAGADGSRFAAPAGPPWLATAGTGDALGGILGALMATHSRELAADSGLAARLAATAVVIHGLAAERAGDGGPFTVLGLIRAVPAAIAALLRESDPRLGPGTSNYRVELARSSSEL
jgi:hydroxyethylthiazole kinase-like uncharacterized protein yjeF